jgi:hypothetical protein
VGPDRQKCRARRTFQPGNNAAQKRAGLAASLARRVHPISGIKPAKGREPQERRRATSRGKTCVARPGSAWLERVAERHAKKARLAHDPCRAAES